MSETIFSFDTCSFTAIPLDEGFRLCEIVSDTEDLIIPAHLGDLPVISIARDALSGNDILHSISIPASVRKIDRAAFESCSNLQRIAIDPLNEFYETDGKGVINKIERVFMTLAVSCEEYEIPSGCLSLGYKSFAFNSKIRTVRIPEGIIEIGEGAFANSSLERISFPRTLSTIGTKAFYSCAQLNDVVLPKSLLSIGESAFEGSGINVLALPASITQIGPNAFSRTRLAISGSSPTLTIDAESPRFVIDSQGALYRKLENGYALKEVLDKNIRVLDVIEGTTSIDDHACQHIRTLEEVILPEGLTHIGIAAFRGCMGLTKVVVPSTLVSIADHAFFQTSLTTFHLPASFKSLADNAIVTCHDYWPPRSPTLREVTVDDECLSFWVEQDMLCERLPDGNVKAHIYFGNRREIELGHHITELAPYLFCCASGIHTLHLHDGITDVGYHAILSLRTSRASSSISLSP